MFMWPLVIYSCTKRTEERREREREGRKIEF
jgi:hypothetical protein